jgi:hypothetical protein
VVLKLRLGQHTGKAIICGLFKLLRWAEEASIDEIPYNAK